MHVCNTTIILSYSSYKSISGVNVQLTVLCFFLFLVFLVVNRIAPCLIIAYSSWRAIVSAPVSACPGFSCLFSACPVSLKWCTGATSLVGLERFP